LPVREEVIARERIDVTASTGAVSPYASLRKPLRAPRSYRRTRDRSGGDVARRDRGDLMLGRKEVRKDALVLRPQHIKRPSRPRIGALEPISLQKLGSADLIATPHIERPHLDARPSFK
jgi:hypothetical protein